MLQYLVILLDERSTSFCHYDVPPGESRLMPLETLKKAIHFAMVENLMIQFVYPTAPLPDEYAEVIESIDHTKLMSAAKGKEALEDADVVIADSLEELKPLELDEALVALRLTREELFAGVEAIKPLLAKVTRLNIVLTDAEKMRDADLPRYREALDLLAKELETLYLAGKAPQLNLLTDRMMLTEMNNCGAGDTTVTLAPNGKFYTCPAFFYDEPDNALGTLDGSMDNGLDFANKQLYKLSHAPICKHCDAWQCRRCIWLNKKLTLEVNTPSHEQCITAHIERNTSAALLKAIRKQATFLPDRPDFDETQCLDPFDNHSDWE